MFDQKRRKVIFLTISCSLNCDVESIQANLEIDVRSKLFRVIKGMMICTKQ